MSRVKGATENKVATFTQRFFQMAHEVAHELFFFLLRFVAFQPGGNIQRCYANLIKVSLNKAPLVVT